MPLSVSDYIYVWNNLLLPVVAEFKPDIIGECPMTPHGFATNCCALCKNLGS
jgi:hypothetical protein